MWNVILNSVNGSKIVQSPYNPAVSGQYVCTCISRVQDTGLYHRYLRVMEFDAEKNHWHDIGNPYSISHTILAWKEEQVCNYAAFKYEAGGLFELDQK